MLRNFKVVLIALALLAIVGSTYTFTTQNTITNRAEGNKARAVSSYTVTNVVYDINTTDPTVVDAIRFDIAPNSGSAAAALVKVQTADGGVWTNCSLAAATHPVKVVTCTYGSLALEDVTALNILASSSAALSP